MIENLRGKLGLGMGVVRGMGLTFRTMFRPPVTIPYPDVKRPVAERFRAPTEQRLAGGMGTGQGAPPFGLVL